MVWPMRSGATRCRLGWPSRKMMRSMSLSAWCISSMDSARSLAASFLKPQSSRMRKCTQYWLTAPSSRKRASLSRSMTCASPFMTTSYAFTTQGGWPGRNLVRAGRILRQLEVVLFGDRGDNVHHIRHAAGALAAFFQLAIDLGWHDDGPGILLQKLEDNSLDFAISDDVALADQHVGWQSYSVNGDRSRAHKARRKPDC